MGIQIQLNEVFDNAKKIIIYNGGKQSEYSSDDNSFSQIIAGWKNLISDAHIMPAFGVSLDSQTRLAMTKGLWAEFSFDAVYESEGMPYERLLVNVEKEYAGFNLIRYSAYAGYDGRCFYYDLVNKNMSEFYDILLNL